MACRSSRGLVERSLQAVTRSSKRLGGLRAMSTFPEKGTFGRQKDLPSLPLPTLEHTFNKYLVTVEPYIKDEQERKEVEQAIKEVLNDDDIKERHQALERLRQTEDSWLKKMWTSQGYMAWRAALPINSNVSGYFIGEFRKKWDQTFSAAAITHGALQYHVELLEGRVAVNMNRDTPNCMDQYTRIFSHTRIPGIVEDHLVKYSEKESQHINVIAGRRIYKLKVMNGREIIPLDELHASFMQIRDEWQNKGVDADPICVLTATERTKWATARNRLLEDPVNSAAVNEVETAIFSVSLEPGVDVTDADCAKTCFVADGRTTWFDKSFQIRVSEDGNPSINIEHSWADAPVPLDMFFNHALKFAEGLSEEETIANAKAALSRQRPSSWPTHEEVIFNKTSQVLEDIRSAEAEIDAAIKDSDVEVYRCPGLGKNTWKQAKISPDAAVQMAMQLAYRRITGSEFPVATYETIGMVSWLCGRTETCRVVSNASEAFVKTMLSGYLKDPSEENRVAAEKVLRAACDAHIKYIVEGQKGNGIDRHMFGLRLQSKDGSQPTVFKQRVFDASGSTGGFILSTSNNSYIPRTFGGLFGCGMPNGYGVCYIPVAEETLLCVESKHSNPETNSLKFCGVVEQCLRDIATIAGVKSTKL